MCKRYKRPKIITLYLLQIGTSNIYKIGYTSNITVRLNHIKYYFKDAHLVCSVNSFFKYESLLHKRFNHCNAKSLLGFNEYFFLNELQINFIKRLFKIIEFKEITT